MFFSLKYYTVPGELLEYYRSYNLVLVMRGSKSGFILPRNSVLIVEVGLKVIPHFFGQLCCSMTSVFLQISQYSDFWPPSPRYYFTCFIIFFINGTCRKIGCLWSNNQPIVKSTGSADRFVDCPNLTASFRSKNQNLQSRIPKMFSMILPAQLNRYLKMLSSCVRGLL